MGAPAAGIPAYFYPWPDSPAWDQVVGMTAGTALIIDPADGPGARIDPNYSLTLRRVRSERLRLYGYVDTDYGARGGDTVEAQARSYREWYGVTGIFLDQAAPGAALLDHYRAISTRLHRAGFEVALNPGQPDVDPRYLDLAEHVVTFEGAYLSYQAQRFPEWSRHCPHDKTWHLVYQVPDVVAMRHALALAVERNAGTFYATDRGMPDPWNGLPGYWTAESGLLAGPSPTG